MICCLNKVSVENKKTISYFYLIELFSYLIFYGISITLEINNNKSINFYFISVYLTGSFPACKLILEQAGPHVVYDRDNMDRTALHLATIRGHGTVLNFLLENGGTDPLLYIFFCLSYSF